MQEVYPNVAMSVQDSPETGQRLLIVQCPAPRKDLIFPMDTDSAEDVGSKLQAPSVKRPNHVGAADLVIPPGALR